MTDTASPQKSINISDDGLDADSPRLSRKNETNTLLIFSAGKQPGSPIFKSKTPLSEHNTKGAFVTGTNLYKPFNDKPPKINEVYDYHDRLNGLVDVK